MVLKNFVPSGMYKWDGVLVASNEASCHNCRRFREFGRPNHFGWPILTLIWLSGLESTLIVGRYGYRKTNCGVGTEPRWRVGAE